jgi:hypothetical protein
MMRVPFLMMLPFKSLADENRRQVRKDEGLNKSNQHFDKVNEHRKCNGYRTKAYPYAFVDRPKNKDEGHQTNDDDVAGHHVRKQTNHKRKRLSDDAQQFHGDQDTLHKTRHGRIEYMSPEVLVGTKEDHEKGDHRQHHRERNVSGHVGCRGDQPENIINENKEKHRQQVRQVLISLHTQVGLGHFVTDKSDHRLNGILHTGWRLALSYFISVGHTDHDP